MFDLAIIGGGPAGYTAAERAAKNGLEVVLFEKAQLGGICLNEGCIPTKTLLYSAKLYQNSQTSSKYGVYCEQVSFDYEKIVARKNKIVRKLHAGIRAKMTEAGITTISGDALISDTSSETITISCNETLFEAKNLLLCCGSETVIPPIKGIDTVTFWTSREALESKQVPESLVIIGGGVIGMEFAGLFNTLGCRVSVIEMASEILPGIDTEIAELLRADYTRKGITFYLGAKVIELRENQVVFSTDNGDQTIDTHQLLLCVGRRPNLNRANLATLNLKQSHNCLLVNELMQTSQPNIYAAGDITGFSMLAHTAAREAEVAVNTIIGKKDYMNYQAVPGVVYTNPEVAGVGQTEAALINAGKPYSVKKLPMTFSGRFVTENEGSNGLCKLLFDANSKLIGAHIIGNPASELIVTAGLAIAQNLTAEELEKIIFPHPSVGEILKETLFAE